MLFPSIEWRIVMIEKKKKILVAIDGSDNSERALIEARKQADKFNAAITILTVLDQSFALHYANVKPPKINDNETREEAGKAILDKALTFFEDFEGEVMTTVRNGSPADEILEELEFGEFDLLIMGSRGLGVFSRTFLGSVSNKVLHHTKTNVLIIK